MPNNSSRRTAITHFEPDSDHDQLPQWLLSQLADMVGHPVLATVHTEAGPAVVVRDTVHRVQCVDEIAYVHFSPEAQGTKVILPSNHLTSMRRGGLDGDPDRIDLFWTRGNAQIKLMSDDARERKWLNAIEGLSCDRDPAALRAETALMQEMIDYEVAHSPEPLAGRLNDLAVRLAFVRLQWGLVDSDGGEEGYDDSASEEDFGW